MAKKSKPKSTEGLTGDAKWRAVKAEIAERNEQAYAKGREQRAARDEEARVRRVADEKRDRKSTPKPGSAQ